LSSHGITSKNKGGKDGGCNEHRGEPKEEDRETDGNELSLKETEFRLSGFCELNGVIIR